MWHMTKIHQTMDTHHNKSSTDKSSCFSGIRQRVCNMLKSTKNNYLKVIPEVITMKNDCNCLLCSVQKEAKEIRKSSYWSLGLYYIPCKILCFFLNSILFVSLLNILYIKLKNFFLLTLYYQSGRLGNDIFINIWMGPLKDF